MVGDVTIREGSRVHLTLVTATRDAAVRDDPDRLDIAGGQGNKHFAFGTGVHRCLGSHLARMELRLVLEEFLGRVPDFELASRRVRRHPLAARDPGVRRAPPRSGRSRGVNASVPTGCRAA